MGWANPTVFDVRTRTAVRSQDIEPSLRRHRPQVIHFSGHGSRESDVILNARDGAASHPLSAKDFAEKLRRYNTENPQAAVRLVVLAGCDTDRAAKLLSECVDCAVGMADRVDDRAMVEVFTPTLYRALGDGYSVAAAVAEAQQALRNDPRGYVREAKAVKPYPRTGMDAGTVVDPIDPAGCQKSTRRTKVSPPAFRSSHGRACRCGYLTPRWDTGSGSLTSTPLAGRLCDHGQAGKAVFGWWCARGGKT